MRTIDLGNSHAISLYTSIHELPANRHTELQCYLIQDAGIGSTMADVEQHFGRLNAFLAAGRAAEAADEAAHLQYGLGFALDRFSTASLAFGCLVASVDSQPVTDTSEDALRALLAQLSDYGLTVGHVESELEAVKKKFRPN